MSKKFEFKNINDFLEWYFDTAYQSIRDRYSNPFIRNSIIKCLRGVEKGLKEQIGYIEIPSK